MVNSHYCAICYEVKPVRVNHDIIKSVDYYQWHLVKGDTLHTSWTNSADRIETCCQCIGVCGCNG